MSWNHPDKEDAKQDVELKMLTRDPASIRDPEPYRRSAVRYTLNGLRRREARRRRVEAAYIQGRTTTATDPAVEFERKETCVLVRTAVARLPPSQCNAIAAVYLNGLSIREACARFGISLAGLNSALYHGRLNLREALRRGDA